MGETRTVCKAYPVTAVGHGCYVYAEHTSPAGLFEIYGFRANSFIYRFEDETIAEAFVRETVKRGYITVGDYWVLIKRTFLSPRAA